MQIHRFVREHGGWFIDLPEYLAQGGSKADLAMVAGADTLLDLIAGDNSRVCIRMDLKPFDGADELRLLELCDPAVGGGNYMMERFEGKDIHHRLWLCDVLLFVFGDVPARIFVARIRETEA